jgi:amidohydrolase
LVEELTRGIASTYGVGVEISHIRGTPPVVNDGESVAVLETAVTDSVEDAVIRDTSQSLGGEDFGWYLEKVPGALARLGVRTPGSLAAMDLHQSSFDVDERCIGVGVSLLTAVALSG